MNKSDLKAYTKISVIFACILISVTPLFTAELKILISGVVALAAFLFIRKENVTKHGANLIIIASILIFMGAFLDRQYVGSISILNSAFAGSIFLGFIFATAFTAEQILEANELLLRIFLPIGIALHLALIFSPGLIDFSYQFDFQGLPRSTFGFLNVSTIDGDYNRRYSGFAYEPGLMQFLINLGIYWRLSKNKGRVDGFLLLAILGLFLTRSTTGFMILAVVLATGIDFSERRNMILAACLLPLAAPILIAEYNFQVSYKSVGSNAFEIRFSRLFWLFDNWNWQEMLLGKGNEFHAQFFQKYALAGFDSFTALLQKYGAVGVVIFVYFISKANYHRAILIAVLLLTFISQDVWWLPFFSIFYFSRHEEIALQR